jgi:hypothetical protein
VIFEGSMGATFSTNGTDENPNQILVTESEGKIHLGRPKSRWKDYNML